MSRQEKCRIIAGSLLCMLIGFSIVIGWFSWTCPEMVKHNLTDQGIKLVIE